MQRTAGDDPQALDPLCARLLLAEIEAIIDDAVATICGRVR